MQHSLQSYCVHSIHIFVPDFETSMRVEKKFNIALFNENEVLEFPLHD